MAGATGVSREDFRHGRLTALVKGLDYDEPPGQEIVFTAKGLGKLCEYWLATGIQVTISEAQLASARVEPAAPPNEPIRLRVTRIPPNKRLLEARFDTVPADHRRVFVNVPDNSKFVNNMVLEARKVVPTAEIYQLVGRPPKRKGRF